MVFDNYTYSGIYSWADGFERSMNLVGKHQSNLREVIFDDNLLMKLIEISLARLKSPPLYVQILNS
jgi:hypothetical protein